MVKLSFQVDPDHRFRSSLARAQAASQDLRVPMGKIVDDFYESEKSLFARVGAGGYRDLTPATKKAKRREVGFVYPILRRSGALEESVTSKTGQDAVHQVVGNSTFRIGTRVPYAKFIQKNRPFIFIGPEVRGIATREQLGRVERWIRILNDHAVAVFSGRRAA